MTVVAAAPSSGRDRTGSFASSMLFLTLTVFVIGTDAPSVVLGGDGHPLVRAAKLAAYMLVLFAAALEWQAVLRAALRTPLLALTLLICLASAIWSVDTGETLERYVGLLATTLAGVLLGATITLRDLVHWSARFALLTGLACLLFVALVPEARGAPPWPNVWRGVFSHKNGMGMAALFLLILASHAAGVAEDGRERAVAVTGAVLMAILLLVSRSVTSQLLGALAIGLWFAGRYTRRRGTWSVLALVAAAGAGSFIALAFATGLTDTLFEALGRNPTLSGRLPLWEELWPRIMERPWLGYGYATFWIEDTGRFVRLLWEPSIHFDPHYSHNGLLEALLSVGVLGASVLIAALLAGLLRVVRLLAADPDRVDLVPVLALLLTFVFANVVEAPALKRDDPIWILTVAFLVAVARQGRRA